MAGSGRRARCPRPGAPTRPATGSGATRDGPGSRTNPTVGRPITTVAGIRTLRSAGPGSPATTGLRPGSPGRKGTTTSAGLRCPRAPTSMPAILPAIRPVRTMTTALATTTTPATIIPATTTARATTTTQD